MRNVMPMRGGPLMGILLVACLARGAHRAPPESPVVARASAPEFQQPLDRPLETGQAVVRYLFHSGWAVQTRNHLLIFDYTEPLPPPGRPALIPRLIEPAEIAAQNLTVFVSHAHSDHYDPDILKWRDAVKAIRYVWGWEGVGAGEDIHFGRERRVVEDRGLEILNIHHEGDGMPESSFLVRVDGLTIFHAGDHGSSRGMKDPVFGDNIRYLAGQDPELDLMFTPTFGGEIDAIRALKPKAVFPMHDGGREHQYAKFAQKVRSLGLDTQVGAAERRGARFLYAQGRLEAYPETANDRVGPEGGGYAEDIDAEPVTLTRNNRAALKKDGRAAIVDRFAAQDTRYDVSEKTMLDQMEGAVFVLERIDRSTEAAGGGLIHLFKRGGRS